MTNIIQFTFETNTVRTIADDEGEPWFVLRDLMDAMGSKTKRQDAVASIEQGLGEGWVKNLPLQTSGGEQTATIVSEAAATFLLSRSNTERGRKLNRLLHAEVLPSLRKTGKYALPTEPSISPAQQNMLQKAIAARFPEGKHRPYAWSRFNNHFQLGSYKQLPASKTDEALAYIAKMPSRGDEEDREKMARRALGFCRFLLYFTPDGRMALEEISDAAMVFDSEQLPALVGDPEGYIKKKDLAPMIESAAKRLQQTSA